MSNRLVNAILYILLFTALCSCRADESLTLTFPQNALLTGRQVVIESNKIKNPQNILIVDSLILLLDRGGDYCLNIYDSTGMYYGDVIKRGNGPNELILPFCMYNTQKNDIAVFDFMLNSLFYYDLNEMMSSNLPEPIDIVKFDEKSFKIAESYDSQFVSIGPVEGGRYVLYDRRGHLIGKFLDYPTEDKYPDESDNMKAMAYQGTIAFRPESNEFALAVNSGAVLEICKVDQNQIVKGTEVIHHLPDYVPERQGEAYGATYERENKFGYVHMAATREYIYLLYSGRTPKDYNHNFMMGDKILVYDWNGEPVYHFDFKDEIISFTVDKNNQHLYIIAVDPEIEIVKYDIFEYL